MSEEERTRWHALLNSVEDHMDTARKYVLRDRYRFARESLEAAQVNIAEFLSAEADVPLETLL